MKKISTKITSALLSGMIAVGSAASGFAVAPSLSASAQSTDNYAKLLQYSLYFYDANMCGKHVEDKSQLSWRGNCHTQDGVDGGFHDAGDHVKFGLPAGYAASVLGLGYYQFGDAFNATGTAGHLQTITDYFADYFKASTTLSGGTVTNFVYQVGDGDADHAEWCPPEMQGPSSRKVFSTNSGASDIAAEYAAALAANYKNFGNEEDLTYAKALFDFSTKYNKCAEEGTSPFYYDGQWSDYYDDQAWAAGWLYIATKDNTYKQFLDKFMSGKGGKTGETGAQWGVYSTLSWNNVTMGAAILSALNGDSSAWEKVNTYLDSHGANSDKYYFEAKWGSARYNTAQQTAALISSKAGAKNYYSWAQGQMDYILGNNPSGYNFVVGMESNSSKYPHHRAASGYKNYDEVGNNTTYGPNGHVLVGALCGGPVDENGTYADDMQDYYGNEVTLDYNATLVVAAAGLYSKYKTGTPDPTSSIPGVKGGSDIVVTTASSQQGETTTTSSTTANIPDTTTTTSTTSQGTQGGTNKEATLTGSNGEYMFNPENADSIEINLTINSNDTEGNGAIGFSDAAGNWTQEEFKLKISGGKGTATVSGEKLKGVNNAKLMIWWPSTATIDSVKLIYNGSAPETTTTTSTTTTTTTTTTTEPTTTTSTETTTTDTTTGFKKIIYGDADDNGTISISDIVATLQYTVNHDKYPLTPGGLANADADGDGVITANDAFVIQLLDAGKITSAQLPYRQ